VTEMLRAAGLGQVDVSHTAITMTSARESTFNLDFTHTWFVSGFRVLARDQTDLLSVSLVLFRTLGQAVGLFLGVIIVCTLAGGLIIVPLEECSRGPVRAWPEHGDEWTKFSAAVTITMLAMFGHDAVEPVGAFVRPALLFFKIMGPLLSIMVTALVTVYMLQESPLSEVRKFDDLTGNTVLVPVGSTAEDYMRRNGVGMYVETFESVDDTLEAFRRGRGDAVMYDFPILEYFATQNSEESLYRVVGPMFEEQQYGIAVGPSAPSWLKETINRAILTTWKTDSYSNMERQWFGDQDDTNDAGVTVSNANR